MRSVRAMVRENAFPLGVGIGMRVWTMVFAALAAMYVPPSPEATRQYFGMEPLRDFWVAPWQRWDTIWYTKIAMQGYAADQSVHFPPFYPLLIRLVMPLLRNNAVAVGLVISTTAALLSFVVLYRLASEMFDERAARRAVLFLAVFPTAFFLFAAYTESVFLALALGAFLCARRGGWVAAGVLGALAAMTRPQGTLFILPLAVEFWMQYRRGQVRLARVWTLLLVLVGGAGHVLWLTYQFGTPAVWFEGEAIMHRIAPPWETLATGWKAVWDADSIAAAALSFLDPFSVVVLVGGLVWGARRLPLSMVAYMAIIITPSLFVITTYSDAYPLTSVSRFVVLAFPLFLLMGSLPHRWWETLLLAFSFLIQTLLLVLFCAWVFVR